MKIRGGLLVAVGDGDGGGVAGLKQAAPAAQCAAQRSGAAPPDLTR